jgi:hypothetical protein
VRESTHNQHSFTRARNDAACPYPSASDVYVRSNNPSDEIEFSDLGLSDFFIAHRRVARRRLERLQLTPITAELFSRGAQPQLERREPYNQVLEAAMGYAASCGVAVMDEVAVVNEKMDGVVDSMNLVDERVVELNGRVGTLLDEVEELRRRDRQLESALEAERNTCRTLERRLVAHVALVDELVVDLGRVRDDHARLVNRVVNGVHPRRAEGARRSPLQQLVEYGGRLV